jgi:hypothetical protein
LPLPASSASPALPATALPATNTCEPPYIRTHIIAKEKKK